MSTTSMALTTPAQYPLGAPKVDFHFRFGDLRSEIQSVSDYSTHKWSRMGLGPLCRGMTLFAAVSAPRYTV